MDVRPMSSGRWASEKRTSGIEALQREGRPGFGDGHQGRDLERVELEVGGDEAELRDDAERALVDMRRDRQAAEAVDQRDDLVDVQPRRGEETPRAEAHHLVVFVDDHLVLDEGFFRGDLGKVPKDLVLDGPEVVHAFEDAEDMDLLLGGQLHARKDRQSRPLRDLERGLGVFRGVVVA